MRYRRLQTLGFVALLVTAIHCLPTEVQADRRRSTTFLAATDDTIWPEWDGVTAHPELTDAHPTTGWPREYGRICVTFTAGPSGEHRAIIDGRTDGDDPRPYLAVVNDGRIRFGIQTVGSIADGEIIPFHTHTVCVDRSYGPRTSLYLDGQLIGTSSTLPAWDWHPTARLGSRYGGADPLGGEIKSIQWRGLRMSCDMRSDTCSDGRQITTVRASPVPCEVAPGVWEMVPADVGCYGVRGLESWAQTTSYLSWGAELDRSPWQAVEGASIDGRILTGPVGSARLLQSGLSVSTGPHTLACWMRALSGNSARLRVFASGGTGHTVAEKSVGPEWATVFHTWEIGGEPTSLGVHIYPDGSTLEIAGCWLTRTATPGRPCWGGEAPVTCAADRHTISTEGWPTESGEVEVEFSYDVGQIALGPYVIDGRAVDFTSATYLRVDENNVLRISVAGETSTTVKANMEPGRTYRVKLRSLGGEVEVHVDGVLEATKHGSLVWAPQATVGRQYASAGTQINGSIRLLRVRSFE